MNTQREKERGTLFVWLGDSCFPSWMVCRRIGLILLLVMKIRNSRFLFFYLVNTVQDKKNK